MRITQVQFYNSVRVILLASWDAQLEDFQETFGVTIHAPERLDKFIKMAEERGWTEHPFYHLMLLKRELM